MKKLLALSIGGISFLCSARELSVGSSKKFDHVLNKKSFALVFFYDMGKRLRRDNPQAYEKIADLDSVVRRIGMRRLYKEGDLQIIRVNLAKGNLELVAQEYGIKRTPAFILFKDGLPVKNETHQIATLHGFVDSSQLHSFIDQYLKRELENRVQEKAQEREYRREMEALYGPQIYWGVGWGYDWPGYYGPYWGGPYWGYGPGYGAGFWF